MRGKAYEMWILYFFNNYKLLRFVASQLKFISITFKIKLFFMRKFALLLTMILVVGVSALYAQTKKVTGTVTSSDDGATLPGVSVVVKGTTIGIITDIDGQYQLDVPSDAKTLVFSFVGMKAKEAEITGSTVDAVLEPDVIGVDEVMVVAYGVTKKESFTGSASSVKAEKLQNIPVTSFEKALGGNVPGLQVSSSSGQPGAASEVRIRGIGSFSADQNPLYVIDGVPVTTESTGVKYSGEEGSVSTPLSTINPADIESITVLKDAAASSLYGSRAANGVIVIKTKQGKAGKTKFTFNTSHGINDIATNNYETVSADQFVELMREAMMNTAKDIDGKSDADAQAWTDAMMNKYYPAPVSGQYADWQKELLRKGAVHNYELSANGGNEKTTFFASISANQTDGIAKNSDLERVTGRLNLKHNASEKLSFTANISFGSVKQNIALGGSYYANPFYSAQQLLLPTDPIRNPDGSYTEASRFNYYNMAREYSLNERSSDTWRTSINSSAEYKIIEPLTFKTTIAYDWIDTDNLIYSSPISRSGRQNKGEVYRNNRKNKRLTSSSILTFNKTFAEDHNFNALVGYEVEDENTTKLIAEGYNVPQGLQVLDASSKPTSVGGSDSKNRMISYLGKVDYNYKGRYYVSASIRRDGSSRLGADERWANFWSVSGSWRLTEEDFMQGVSWLDDFKLRASYGTNGTLPVDWFGHKALYSVGAYNSEPAINYTQIANPNLSWEESHNLNAGFDFRFKERFSGSFEYFVKNTTDMLMEVPLSRVTGFSSMWQNVGEMKNKGWEFTFNADILRKSELTWNASFNLSHYENEIVKLSNGESIFTFPYIRKEGEAYNSFYLRDWAGVDPETGKAQWYVIDTATGKRAKGDNGEEIKTTDPTKAAKAIVGKADPDLMGGISNSFGYKGFTLDFLFNFSIGGDIYNTASYSMESDGNAPKYNIMTTQLDRWQKPGDKVSAPKRYWNSDTKSNWNSSRRVHRNDYLRLKNVTLGYNLPKSVVSKMKLSNVKVYFTGTNLLTFASQDIVDPEQPVHGSSTWEIPTTKTYTVGVSIGF
ncbi:TonB-dependent receptor [Prolixibacteraceae bacterium JC049]|nr:TonB-dependent receptor [Prolixibacteraceae bacterium JC049]